MPTVKTSFKIRDGMSPALKKMTASVDSANSSLRAMQIASQQSVDTANLDEAARKVAKVEDNVESVSTDIRDAANNQDKFNTSVNRSNKSSGALLKTVRRLAIAAGGITLGRKFTQTADQYSGIQARLNLINDGQQSVAELNAQIFESADRARGSYSDMADVIGRLGITASDAFSSNDEMLRFSEIMTKSFKVAGASAQEQSAAMYQLSQAMASGRLQGDEFRSILENAPLLARSIAKEMNVSLGVLKEMSSEGKITSDVIKNALFNSAQEINTQFEQMPMRFDELIMKMKNSLIQDLQPAFSSFSEFLNSQDGAMLMNSLTQGISNVASGIAWATENGLRFAAMIQNNWSQIEPIVMGTVGALAAYKAIAIGSATATSIMTVATAAQTVGIVAAAKAQWGLNLALLASPLTWLAMAIGVVAGLLLYKWVQSVGGAKIAWMVFTNNVRYGADMLMVAFMAIKNSAKIFFDYLGYGILLASNAVLNGMGAMKVGGLRILQAFINMAINDINGLITAVNKIPGVSIDLIDKVSFASKGAAVEEAKKQGRQAAIDAAKQEMMSSMSSRQNAIDMAITAAERNKNMRDVEIAVQKNAVETDREKKTEDYMSSIAGNTGATAGNTGAMKESLEISEEDLKYMRDIAEQEVIDRTVLRDVKVDLKNTFGDIRETADIDGVIQKLADDMNEAIASEGEGVFNV